MEPAPFRHQPNAWTCGPAALRNAIAVYGQTIDVRRVITLSGITNGTIDTVPGLSYAAEALGFKVVHEICHEPEEVVHALHDAGPAILCVAHYSHWVTYVRGSQTYAWVCDPARGQPPLVRLTWRELCRQVVWGLADEQRFDIYHVMEEK